MLTPPKPGVPKAAEPRYGSSFDPWNSSSTGHQRAENRLGASRGWRDSRNAKLASQFRGGAAGGERVSDQVGAGAKDYDPKLKALVRPEVRARAKRSVMDMLVKPGTMRESMASAATAAASNSGSEAAGFVKAGGGDDDIGGGSGGGGGLSSMTEDEESTQKRKMDDDGDGDGDGEAGRGRKLFEGVVVYVNGSTHPLISDHKLKHVLAENGGRMSMHLGRRQVTHVILGRPAGGGAGAGGGLAGGKLQREIQKVQGCGVKFVSVEWVLESLKAGKQLPEARFSNLKVAPKGQQSVYGLYSKPKTSVAASDNEPPPSAQKS